MTSASVSDPIVPLAAFSDDDLPGLFRTADSFSLRRQALFMFLVRIRLAFLVLVAISGVVRIRYGTVFEWSALATGLLLISILAIEVFLRISGPENDWYDARVLAESTKTLAWRYAIGAHPFPVSMQPPEDPSSEAAVAARRDFLAEIQNLLADVPDIGAPTDTVSVVTDWMASLRASSLRLRQETYVRYRILDQQAWYARKAALNRKHQTLLWTAIVIAEALALVVATLRFVSAVEIDLSGIAVSIIAAGTGWIAVRQYATLHRSYAFAAQDLAIVRARLETVLNEEQWAAETADAEESISRAHTLWRSSRSSRFNRQPGVL